MSLYVVKEWDRERDENFIVYSWLKSYARSREGRLMGAHMKSSAGEDRLWQDHKPVLFALLDVSDVRIAEAEAGLILGWLCTMRTRAGATAVHYALVRRDFDEIRSKVIADLFGDLSAKATPYSHELVEVPKVPVQWVYVPSLRQLGNIATLGSCR